MHSLWPHTQGGTHRCTCTLQESLPTHTSVGGGGRTEEGTVRRVKDACRAVLKIHQPLSSGPVCMILWTKHSFSFQPCWDADPVGLCIHLLKSYFIVPKLTFSSITSREISSLLLGFLWHQGLSRAGDEWPLTVYPHTCLLPEEQGLIKTA